jgi:hypothetical protein
MTKRPAFVFIIFIKLTPNPTLCLGIYAIDLSSSFSTIDLPDLSWPVTTRRIAFDVRESSCGMVVDTVGSDDILQ